MEPLVISLVLLSAVMHALRNFFNKKALDKQAFIWWYEIFGLLFFAPLFFFTLVVQDFSVSISWIYIFLSGATHFVYWYFLSSALQKGDLSVVYPIMRSSPALVLVFSIIFLKEDLSPLGLMGVLLVSVGVYAIDMKNLAFSQLLKPLGSLKRDWTIRFAFLTLISAATYSLVDKLAVNVMDPVIFAFMYPWISFGLFSIYLLKVKEKGVLAKEWHVHKGSILLCGGLSIFGYFFILVAFTFEKVIYVVGLRQVSIVFAVLLGGHFLKEGNRFIRTLFSIVIFVGCYLIAIAGG